MQQPLQFKVYYQVFPDSVLTIWDEIVTELTLGKVLPKRFSLSQIAAHPEGKRSEADLYLDAGGVRKIIEERKLPGFCVRAGRGERTFELRLGEGPTNDGSPVLGLLTFWATPGYKTPSSWQRLIEVLITKDICSIAYQNILMYQNWQNTRRMDNYLMFVGKVPPGAKTWVVPVDPNRKLYFPNEEDEVMIDTSLNPGRTKNLGNGVLFLPAAELWLGPGFWKKTSCTKEEVLAADFFLEKRDTPHFLYLKSWPEAFTRPDGEQGRIQQKLWQLFFHEDCEWPPGFGGISDLAEYGPPALLPASMATPSS